MSSDSLCPFSKPILGKWCRCHYARLSDRCAGKMFCIMDEQTRSSCHALVDELKKQSRFILGQDGRVSDLTHAQLMKIRCGGLQGMQRVMSLEPDQPPDVLAVIAAAKAGYGSIAEFPYNLIVQDIQAFSHRRKRLSDK